MVTLGNKSVGDIVKISENGVATNYIVVHKGKPSDMYDDSCDGVWVLREECHSGQHWDINGSYLNNEYENSDIEIWLNNTFFDTIDEKIRNEIHTAKIPFKKGTGNASTGVYSGVNGLPRKVFLLSGYELGWTKSDSSFPEDGAKLSYFESGTATSENNKRIANLNGSPTTWWIRSPHTSYDSLWWTVNTDGSYKFVSDSDYGARPAFVLPYDITINDDGSVSTECTKASINLKNAITSGCIVACTLKVNGSIPDDAICNYEVTNNANDSVPVWEDCTNESKAGYPYVFKNKTSENGFAFSFRVSIERGSSNVSGYISSVSGGFKC